MSQFDMVTFWLACALVCWFVVAGLSGFMPPLLALGLAVANTWAAVTLYRRGWPE